MTNKNKFYLKNGKTFSNIKELAKELKEMSSNVYEHHVNPLKNDFENWVKNSIKDEKLAKKIEGHLDKVKLELEILRHLVHENISKKIIKKKKVSTKLKNK